MRERERVRERERKLEKRERFKRHDRVRWKERSVAVTNEIQDGAEAKYIYWHKRKESTIGYFKFFNIGKEGETERREIQIKREAGRLREKEKVGTPRRGEKVKSACQEVFGAKLFATLAIVVSCGASDH